MTRDNYNFNLQTTQTIERHMTELRKGNEEKLEQMRRTVDEKLNETLTQRLDSSFKTVSEQLENVYKSLGEMKVLSTGVTENVTSLNRILTNVKARGTWAEVQLEGLLDQTIPGMFVRNYAPDSASREVVEFAVGGSGGPVAYAQVGVAPKSRPIQVATGSGIQTIWGRSRVILG